MRPFLFPLVLAASLFVPVAPAHAGEGRYAEVVAQLGLDAGQQARVEEIIYQSKSGRVEIRARLERAKLDLRHALGADTLDEKAVHKATDALKAATGDLVQNRVDQVLALRKVLTPAQFDQLEALRKGERGDLRERVRDRLRGGEGHEE